MQNHRLTCRSVALLAMFSACAGSASRSTTAVDDSDFRVGEPFPALRRTLLTPIHAVDCFTKVGPDEWRYTGAVPATGVGDAFATDEESLATARAWLRRHFGELPEGQDLLMTVSSVRSPVRGLQVFCTQTYRRIPTDCVAFLTFRGREVERARIRLMRLDVVPGSAQRLIDKQRATDILREFFSERQYEAMLRQCDPKLIYEYGAYFNDDFEVPGNISPQWAMVPGTPLRVDAITGEVWRNG